MKVNLTIFFSLLALFSLSYEGEQEILDALDESIHNNYEITDSILYHSEEIAGQFSDEGKFKFVIYYLIHHDANNKTSSRGFNVFLSQLKVHNQDKALLRLLNAVLLEQNDLNKIATSQTLRRMRAKDISNDRKALIDVFLGIQQNELKSEKYFDNALRYAKKSRIPILPSLVLQFIANKYRQQGDYKQSVSTFQKALDFSQKNKHDLCFIRQSLAMSEIQVEMENFKKAEQFLQKSAFNSKKLKNDWYLASSLIGLGNIDILAKNYRLGISDFQKALLIYYKLNSDRGVAQTHNDLGKAYFLSQEYDLSEKNFQLSQTFFNKINDYNNGVEDLYENYALLKYKRKKYGDALKLINKAIEKQVELKENNLELQEALEIRAKIYAALGYGEKAYYELAKISNYKDSIYSENLQQQIADLSELYESEQKSKRIREQDRKLKEERNERLLNEKQLENIQLRNSQIIIIFSFSTLLLLALLLIFYFRSKQRQLKLKQTETELRQQLLRSQMNPHFVFNAMSVIQSYIYDNDIDKSSEFLVSLSRLMRLILENSAKESIKLTTELEILNRYLFIQKERFENRFEFEIHYNENIDPERISIPPMILQPFVENATEHGELDKVKNGKIRITYRIDGQLLIFVVEDNGIGREASKARGNKRSSAHKSMAISITQKRIELMRIKYNIQGFVKIEDLEEVQKSGTRVTVAMPLMDK